MRWCLICLLAGTQGGPATQARTSPPQRTELSSERINVEFQDADIHHVLRVFADLGNINIVVEDGVSGRVTATLRSTTWQRALTEILRSQGLEGERDGNIIYVRPAC
jgi:type IV pilus assembly protein PilQ